MKKDFHDVVREKKLRIPAIFIVLSSISLGLLSVAGMLWVFAPMHGGYYDATSLIDELFGVIIIDSLSPFMSYLMALAALVFFGLGIFKYVLSHFSKNPARKNACSKKLWPLVSVASAIFVMFFVSYFLRIQAIIGVVTNMFFLAYIVLQICVLVLFLKLKWGYEGGDITEEALVKKLTPPVPVAPYAATRPQSSAPKSVPERLMELKSLYDKGVISEEEYQKAKKQLLDL